MAKPELEFHAPAGEWKRVGTPESAGIWQQELAADSRTGDSTVIQRYEPGAQTGGGIIAHDFWEEVLILSGELTDITLGETFIAGMYACRPPGMPHGPYRSASGCQMIVTSRV